MGKDDNTAMDGFPEHGDAFEGADPQPQPDPSPQPQPQPDANVDLRARLDRLERDNADLRRLIPPASPASSPSPSQASNPEDIDWDKELFANPKEALKKHGDMVAKKVTEQLRAEYQKDRGTQQFWDRFYEKHPDLRQDHDLVEVTLNSNIGDLANIRVEDAYQKLADLTRERILRYAGGAARKRPKAQVEGGSGTPAAPSPPAPPKGDEGIVSLSDMIRARRERRRAGAA